MDYSLLLGLHDCARAEQENRERAEREEDDDNDDEDDSESGSGVDSRGTGTDRVWRWGGVSVIGESTPTPPESPHAALMRETSLQYEDAIIPELDIYAIPSAEGKLET